MSCFSFFKERSKSKRASSSAPNLGQQSDVGSSSSASSAAGRKRMVKSSGSAPSATRSLPEMFQEKEHNLRVFSYSEMKEATNRFDRALKLGEGGFGSVYKGLIKPVDGDGEPFLVAIKKLNKNGLQNKSLEDHLFNKALPPLPWNTRLRILLGAAQGLAYLHEGMEIQVIYQDFKTSNVLLDNNFEPKLSDFGLAREGPSGDNSHVSTAVVGTRGYAAPEYVETGHLTAMSDLYSFGVVLYETLTGRRALERNLPSTEQKLLEWVKLYPADSKKFGQILDPRLRGQYSLTAARGVAKLADSCLLKNPKQRPIMSEVVETLKEAITYSTPSRNEDTVKALSICSLSGL